MEPEALVRRYDRLRAALDSGAMAQEAFVAACRDLRAQDAEGRWWAVDTAGQLLQHDAARGDWVAAAAPARPPAGRGGRKAKGAREATDTAKAAPAPAPAAAATGAVALVIGLPVSFAATYLLSDWGWDVFRLLPVQINALLPVGGCTAYTPGTVGMYLCSAFVGLRVMFGSLVLAVLLILLRKPIAAIIGAIGRLLPQVLRGILPAILAGMFFAVVWAGSHYDTGHLVGFMSQRSFPALVGALSFLAIQAGPGLMARAPGLFAARDRLSGFLRWLMVLATPLLVSLVITYEERVSNEALKQQIVVIVGMLVAFVLLTPRPQSGPQGGRA